MAQDVDADGRGGDCGRGGLGERDRDSRGLEVEAIEGGSGGGGIDSVSTQGNIRFC